MSIKDTLREAKTLLGKTERLRKKINLDIYKKGGGYGNLIKRGKRKKKAAQAIDVLVAAAGRSTGNSGERGETIDQSEKISTGGR